MSPTVELRRLEKRFGPVTAVDGLSLAIPPGTIYGLLGPNGAGKTTTLRIAMDIVAPDAGEVLFFGRPRRRRDLARVGYLPEERGLYRRMTVAEHLAFFAELHDVDRRRALASIDRWLERLELTAWKRRRVEELSKGMQQKVQLAATLLHEPEILVLDEPFSGLDPINQQLFKELLDEYKRRGRTILFSTHVMEQAEKLCDSICLLYGGRSILDGELAALKAAAGSRSVRVAAAGDLSILESLPGIERAEVGDGAARLLLAPGTDRSGLLRLLASRIDVREFRAEEPGLEEIFIAAVRRAGGAPEGSGR